MTVICAIGIDPGLTTGLAVVSCEHAQWVHPAAVQCDAGTAPALADWLFSLHAGTGVRCCGQIEEFRAGRGPGSRGRQAAVTRTLVMALTAIAGQHGILLAVRPAAIAKPWGTDKRLAAAGLLDVSAGLPHARDALRHALYAACHDGGAPDPLSRQAG